MRSSRLQKAKPQDDEWKAHPPNPPQWGNSFDGILRVDRHAAFAAPVEDEKSSPCKG